MYSKKFTSYPFDGIWQQVFGQPSTTGSWLIYGAEKHGKTTFCLMLASMLSSHAKTLYISAEEGIGQEFVGACERAKLDPNNRRLQFSEYIHLDELSQLLEKQKSPKVVVLDNITVYNDELKGGGLKRFMERHPNKLLIWVAHEERKEPYTSAAKLCRKLAKVIVRIEGLTAKVGGRVKGGIVTINEQKAELYHGTAINQD